MWWEADVRTFLDESLRRTSPNISYVLKILKASIDCGLKHFERRIPVKLKEERKRGVLGAGMHSSVFIGRFESGAAARATFLALLACMNQ